MKESKLEKTIEGLGLIRVFLGEGFPGQRETFEEYINILHDAEEMLKKQKAVIDKVRKAYELTVVEDE